MASRTCALPSCHQRAEFKVFAAYDLAGDDVHPRLSRYPMPFTVACGVHIGEELLADMGNPGTTKRYVVEPLASAEADQ